MRLQLRVSQFLWTLFLIIFERAIGLEADAVDMPVFLEIIFANVPFGIFGRVDSVRCAFSGVPSLF